MRRCLLGLMCVVVLGSPGMAAELIYEQDFSNATGTNPDGWSYSTYGYILSRTYLGQYEQRKTQVHPDPTADDDTRAAAYYNYRPDPARDDYDWLLGSWRDATIETEIATNGQTGIDAGVLFRARGFARSGGNMFLGDAYCVQIVGDETDAATTLELLRFRGNDTGSDVADPDPHVLATDLGVAFDASTPRLIQITSNNVTRTHYDAVDIQVNLYNGLTADSGILRTISFTDDSDRALSGPGSVGYRTLITQTTINPPDHPRGIYDNLTVYDDNDGELLWYDDYYDNRALGMTSFSQGGVTEIGTLGATDLRYHVRGEGVGIGAAVIDHVDVMQPEWEDVTVSATMRIGHDISQLYSGLAVRAQNYDAETGSGDLYLFHMTGPDGDESAAAELYRVRGGQGTEVLLGSVDVSATLASREIYLKVDAVTNDDGNVELSCIASLAGDYSDPIAEISFLDDSADKITGPGSAGFIVQNWSESQFAANFDDFSVWQYLESEPPALDGDLDGDGFVGSSDLDIVRGNWGSSVPAGDLGSGDPSGDGLVGSGDLDIVRANWGNSLPATVPEPGCLVLFAVGLLFAGSRRRR